MTVYELARAHRMDAQSAQRWLVRVCVVGMLASLAAVVVSVGWVVMRLDRFEAAGGSHGVMAVIDKCGQPYEFQTLRSGEWQPDEALYFNALEDFVDCARGLRVPQEGGRSCWLKVFPVLGDDANKAMHEYLTEKFGKDDQTTWLAGMQKLTPITVEMLAGSTKSEDGRYRLQWRELDRASGRRETWSGTFAVSRVAATAKEIAEGNAIGMRIDSFSWQRDQVIK